MHSILVVDDEPNYQIVLSELLKDEGYEVFTADSAEAALPLLRTTDLDLVLTDMKMPGMDGIEFLKKIKEFDPELPVILITAYAEVERAVEAMHLGAFTYLAKPFSQPAASGQCHQGHRALQSGAGGPAAQAGSQPPRRLCRHDRQKPVHADGVPVD